jgi:hypothetical protein
MTSILFDARENVRQIELESGCDFGLFARVANTMRSQQLYISKHKSAPTRSI